MPPASEILKDYGPAIGPALAFLFGLLAFLAKYKVDHLIARWTLTKRIGNLQDLVEKAAPPRDFFPLKSESGFLHAHEARNLTNLARFYSRLLALKPAFDALDKAVAEHGNSDQTLQFHFAKWWFDILVTKVEKWRAEENFRLTPIEFENLGREWSEFVDAISGKMDMQYISFANRTE